MLAFFLFLAGVAVVVVPVSIYYMHKGGRDMHNGHNAAH